MNEVEGGARDGRHGIQLGLQTTIYEAADRDVWVQPLPLTTDEKRRLLARLEHDVQDAHKRYAYDHLTDNCSTRVRDALDEATGGKLRAMQVPSDGRTYRDLARRGFFGMRSRPPSPTAPGPC